MVAALPRHIRLKLEQTLAQWRQWDCDPPLPEAPAIQYALGQGLSNFSVRVGGSPGFVVRIDGINPAAHGLNRQGEWRALLAAHQAGLAPAPRYFNPELTSLVCDYLPPDEHQPLHIPAVGGLLRDIHRLPARHHRLDLAERMLNYERQLERNDNLRSETMLPYRAAVSAALFAASQQPTATVLCHNDLLRANRLYSGDRLWAIDWEYCAMGSPWYDLAVVVAGDELDNQDRAALLASYLQRPATDREELLLLQYCCVYRYLELLWYLAVDHADLDNTRWQYKLARLTRDLDQA